MHYIGVGATHGWFLLIPDTGEQRTMLSISQLRGQTRRFLPFGTKCEAYLH